MTTSALALIRSIRPPTPVQPLELEGRTLLLKREDTGPNGAFKWRGALLAAADYQQHGARAIVSASTGNHGAAVAWAAARLGMDAHIAVPDDVVPAKAAFIESQGATLHRSGPDLAAAAAHARRLAAEHDAPYFEDGASEAQLAGTATIGAELLAANLNLDAVVVPVACGALAAGLAAALHEHSPVPVIGVQSIHFSRLAAQLRGEPYEPTGQPTIADGLADDRIVEPAYSRCREHLHAVVTVDEDDIRHAIRTLWLEAGVLAEGAGAAALAGLMTHPDVVPGRRVAIVVTGGNLAPQAREEILG